MSENNQMIEKPKMGFIQRMRKAILMRNITGEKYEKAPETLKADMDVVIELLSKSPESASMLPQHFINLAIEQDETIFAKLPAREQLSIAELEPKYVSKLSDQRALGYIHRFGMVYCKYLPESLQERLLTEQVQVDNSIINFTPETSQRSMDNFLPSVVERVVSKAAEKARAEDATVEDKQAYEDMFYNAPVGWMSIEMQRKMVEIDSKFIDKVSEEVFDVLVEENPELIKSTTYYLDRVSLLPVELQLKLAAVDSKVVSSLSQEAIQKYEHDNPEAIQQLDSDTKVQLAAKHPEYEGILDEEQKKKLEELNVQKSEDVQFMGEAEPQTPNEKEQEDFQI